MYAWLLYLFMLSSQFQLCSSTLSIKQSTEKFGTLELSEKEQTQDALHSLCPLVWCIRCVSHYGNEEASPTAQNFQSAVKADSEAV